MIARLLLTCIALALPGIAAADLHAVILRGLAGDPELEERFQGWSARLAESLETTCLVAPERIHVPPAPDAKDADAPLTRDSARGLFEAIAPDLDSEDTLLVVLIGHGSLHQEPKFMVSGPDIAAADLFGWLDPLPSGRQLVVNAASSSAAFINALSGASRIIVTSTHTGTEKNAPEFMEHAVRVLEECGGDANRDGALSFLEWMQAAAASTRDWFEGEGFIVTEHALLDDDGDGRGTRLAPDPEAPDAGANDGGAAAGVIIRPDPAWADADPAQYARYREALAAVEAWKAEKSNVSSEVYWSKLEALLLEAARCYPVANDAPDRDGAAETTETPQTPETPESPESPEPPAGAAP